jgi:hypothetical protein
MIYREAAINIKGGDDPNLVVPEIVHDWGIQMAGRVVMEIAYQNQTDVQRFAVNVYEERIDRNNPNDVKKYWSFPAHEVFEPRDFENHGKNFLLAVQRYMYLSYHYCPSPFPFALVGNAVTPHQGNRLSEMEANRNRVQNSVTPVMSPATSATPYLLIKTSSACKLC